uniref:Uncharacterized protein n=1 Tax=Siphoviridae sp. ctF2K4 TaxID=2825401 RepID=A0A8S5VF82_9CAUD|nr:MAG TPA: hypothetical protein [Siphoviridae sp. ctF2K4]
MVPICTELHKKTVVFVKLVFKSSAINCTRV